MPDIYMDVDTALSEVPVNIMPLTDDGDFKTRETGVAYNAAGMDLVWNFVTTSGSFTQTAVTPTTSGSYDWGHQGDGMYTIEIPASGGASINNDTEGFGWFTGIATGVLPWRGPIIGFRAAALNNSLIDGGDQLEVNATSMRSAIGMATNNLDTQLSVIENLVDDLETRLGAPSDLGSGASLAGNITDVEARLTAIDVDVDTITNYTDTILNRLGSFTGSGVNTVLGFFQALMRSDATTPSDVGGTYDDATDSLQAIADSGSGLDAAGVRAAVGLASANLDTQLGDIPTANENADALLKRDWTTVSGEAEYSVLKALRFLRNKWAIVAALLTIYKEDGSTESHTMDLTTNSSSDPVTGVEPN